MKKVLSILAVLCAVACAKQPVPAYDVIFDTDANNELDDQHAIAYLLMNPETFNTLGITTNNTHNGGGIAGQSAEARRVVTLCGKWGKGIEVYDGAEAGFEDITGTVAQNEFDGCKAVNFIIDNARSHSPEKKLTLIAVGKLTNVALALQKAPEITPNVRLVWLGSNYPNPGEYNLVDDIPSMNYVLDTDIEFEIVTVSPPDGCGTNAVRVTKEFVMENFAGKGPRIKTAVEGRHGGSFNCFGDYSANLFSNIKLSADGSRALFDLCAVCIVKNPAWAQAREIPAPTMIEKEWVERPENTRKITIWEYFDRDGIVDDFLSTLDKCTR